ncbi:ATP-binding cassette, subfamily C (CFTR/MRP), member 1 [Entomortierella parvispora]|uniref:ATP-binding cassette, subfamily C (CFTR/MRP), member 1 n=1 Tax=Entomortierella parvispora TaxID=205924 RepID=A0A9P3LRQ8_9FUNG|nr:ATP-binding cassette, subfamily C (CFTR/MRP), member 1 [Entomortierella parvispora]
MPQPMVVQWPSVTEDRLFANEGPDRNPLPFLESLCRQREGWGPSSPDRFDLTPCFEYSVLYGALSAIALLVFLGRFWFLSIHGQAHHLGRTAWIYWPTQAAMTLAAGVILGEAWVLATDETASTVAVLGCIGMGLAWTSAVMVNRLEHMYEIRSSTSIFAFYVASILSTLVILRTHFESPISILTSPSEPYVAQLQIAFVGILLVGFIFEAWPRGSTQVQRSSGACEYDKANIFSRLTFYFYQPIVTVGLRRTLTAKDIANILPENLRTEHGCRILSRRWNNRVKRWKEQCRIYNQSLQGAAMRKTVPRPQPPSLFWTVIRTHLVGFIPILVCRIVIVLLSFILPALLSRLLSYLDDYEDKPLSYGITLACSMFVVALSVALLYTYNRYQMFLIGASTRAALISMVYRKSLRLSPGSRNKSTTGEITNHMAVDAEQWGDAMIYLSMWISIPIEIVIGLLMLYQFLGWTMLAGFIGMLLLLPLQAWQARVFESMQDDKLSAMDQRVRLTTEVLAGIKVVKLYGWESAFRQRVLNVRNTELVALKRLGLVQSFMSIVFISSSLIISLITFGVYGLWGGPNFTPGKLTPQTVFVSMTLFGMLRGPIASLSDATTTTISVVVGTRRIQEFLLSEEVDEDEILRFRNPPQNPNDPSVLIQDASFTWADRSVDAQDEGSSTEHTGLLADFDGHPSEPPTLQNLDLAIPQGSLTAVVGRVAQGKSSLFSAIIGEMYKLQGKVQVCGRIAFVPQQAWVINATLRENIVFGSSYDEEKYQQILFACGLLPDIAMLPGGDMTEIGERGINLSGGQKQRVSLARAAYADYEIYLLDDPLSAVDAHVDQHLWENLIGPMGLLRNKTRILATHGIHHLKDNVDQIVLLKDGKIAEKGSYSDLMKSKLAFYQLIKEYHLSHTPELKKRLRRRSSAVQPKVPIIVVPQDDQSSTNQSSQSTLGIEPRPDGDALSFEEVTTDQDTSEGDDGSGTEGTSENEVVVVPKDEKKDTQAGLIAAEKMKEGGVGFDILLTYIRSASYTNSAIIFALFAIAQVCLVSTSLWLKHWIKKTKEYENSDLGSSLDGQDHGDLPSVGLFLGVYAALTFAYVMLYVVVSYMTFSVARIRASEILHRDLLIKILRLPMSFFDTTPLGRILNRFSSDIAPIDERIPNKFFDALFFLASVSSTLILIMYTTPAFLIALPFLCIGYYTIQYCFLQISRVLQRIYSVSKSPVYQHFNESLNGVSTIRAMAIQDRFIRGNAAWADNMANNFLASMTSKRWVEVQLRLLSTFVLLCAALFAVLGRATMDPSLVGMTLSFAMAITEEVTSLVRILCDLQNHLVSVERVIEYTDMKTEAPEHTAVYLPPNWPDQGRVRFLNYSTRYREGLDLVIKNITLDIAPSEKVGIVGRTGAGKSSLTLALFRIIEAAGSQQARDSDNTGRATESIQISIGDSPSGSQSRELEGGSIEIDGVDISTVGLEDLRQHLAIIPQDPTLFAGTVRDNLDPFQDLEDVDLWEALERSHLKKTIAGLPGGLSFEVSQNGENFSVGQRSLICLARALLRKTKILILDEATAAVDVETDELIQKTIRTEFRDRTVLTIAHRIKTVMDSDKILVLEQGCVQEFEKPQVLLQKEDSLFYKLAEQAGEI